MPPKARRRNTIRGPKAPHARRQIEFVESPDAPVIYANICAIRATPEEFVLQFGRRAIADPNQVEPLVTIFTNLFHAKRLAAALVESIERYEAIFGEIVADPGANVSQEVIAEALKKRQSDDSHE